MLPPSKLSCFVIKSEPRVSQNCFRCQSFGWDQHKQPGMRGIDSLLISIYCNKDEMTVDKKQNKLSSLFYKFLGVVGYQIKCWVVQAVLAPRLIKYI